MRRLAFVLSLIPLAATAAPHTVLYRHPQDARPAFAAGDLAGPTGLAPEAAARALLRAAPDLAPVEPHLLGPATVRHLARGAVVRFALEHAGIPVADATVVVRLDEQGRARMVLGAPVRVDEAASAAPALDLAAARRLLAARVAERAPLCATAAARLVWTPGPDRVLRLAWELRLAPQPILAESLLFRLDARTGALLVARNLVRFADQGKVYQFNPTKTPTLQTVTLGGRAPNVGQPADALSNEYVNVLNCKDEHATVPLSFGGGTFNVHMCTEKSTTVRDGSGDYLYDPPTADIWNQDPTTPANEDVFSEVQMYYHVMQAYAYFQAFGNPGFTALDAKPVQATVNFRIPIDYTTGDFDLANLTNVNGILYPFPNAMFMPPGQLIPGLIRPASIVFGQGATADFAYDGDVVFHEFTHAVVWSTADLMGPGLDQQGLDPAPNGLNEGFADIFSAFISGDAQTGEYAGGSLGLGPIRDLSIKYRCPDLLWGESHQDSMAFSWAVWAARTDLGSAADAPVFAALVSLPSDASFGEAAAAVEQELTDGINAAAGATARDYFVEANLLDCQRVIDYTEPREILMTEGTSIGLSPVPGYLQFKYPIPTPALSLKVHFKYGGGATSFFGGGTPAYKVYLRKDVAITWDYSGTNPAGAKDHELTLTSQSNGTAFEGELQQALPPGDYFLQIVSTGQAGGTLQDVTITHVPAPQDDAAVQDDAGTGADAGDDKGGRGCDCGVGSAGGAGLLALFAVLGLALLHLRRRA